MLHVYKAINQLSNEVRQLKAGIKNTEKVIAEKEKMIEQFTRQVQEWEVKDENKRDKKAESIEKT